MLLEVVHLVMAPFKVMLKNGLQLARGDFISITCTIGEIGIGIAAARDYFVALVVLVLGPPTMRTWEEVFTMEQESRLCQVNLWILVI